MSARAALSQLCIVFVLLSGCAKRPSQQRAPLLCYVGGTMRPVMEHLAEVYESKTGQPIEIDYAGSGECLIKIDTTRRGDIYVCHDPFLGLLKKKGLCRQGWTVAGVKPMIAVAKGNPKNITSLKDLARPGIRLVLTHPVYSTAGHIVKVMFAKAKLGDGIEKNVVTRTKGGGSAANAVGLGHGDAAIVWNAVIHLRKDKLDMVDIEDRFRPQPGVDAVTTATFGPIDMSFVAVTLATLKCSKQPEAASAFAEFVASDANRSVFEDYGFLPRPQRSEARSLTLYCGAGIRPAVSEMIEAFSAETGTEVEADYSGSGILLSRLKLRQTGDLYMPGDVNYVELAEKEDLIDSKYMACYFVPVIIVPKGNPKGIAGLKDLTRPGVRLALGSPEACAIGRKCVKIFKKNEIKYDDVQKNVVFSSLTVNELGVQIKAGQVDAAIVWDAMAAYFSECSDTVVIPPEQNIVSKVAISILRFSKRKALARQFVDFVTGDRGRAIFKGQHYTTALPE